MKLFERRHQSALQAHEGGRRKGNRKIPDRNTDQADSSGNLLDFFRR